MRIGVFLHDHFYRKHCGKPLSGLQEGGWFLLNVSEAVRATPRILADLRGMGVECAEIAGPLGRAEEMTDALQGRKGLGLILHTEGDPSPDKVASSNPHIRRAAVENILRNIDLVRELGAGTLVLHSPPFSREAAGTFREAVTYAETADVVLALENSEYGRGGIEDLLRYGEELDSPNLAFTFDVGHCNIGFCPATGANMLGTRIAHIHWHDNEGKSDQHLGPAMGNVDFAALFEAVWEIDKAKDGHITVTLECDKPIVDYEGEFRKLQRMREQAQGRGRQ